MKAKKGLEGVIADESAISKVIPEKSSLIYRGYSAEELAKNSSFLAVVYLLWKGELPSKEALSKFINQEKQARKTDKRILNTIKECAQGHPMDVLRTAISMAGALEESHWDDSDAILEKKAIYLLANIPLWMAAHNRFRKKLPVIEHSQDQPFVENFFHLYFDKIPQKEVLSAFSSSLILYAEHGFNASTFTARVITSTTSDIYSAVVGAIGSLKGPLHGGANEQVMYMMKEIGEPEKAKEWMLKALKEKRKIMGFGHRVYKKGDSRVPQMFACAKTMAEVTHNTKWIEMYNILRDTMLEQKQIYPNLDFPAGPAYYMMGFDIDMFTPLFVMSRISGWVAHIMEQRKNNRIIRPLCEYTGPRERPLPQGL
ncbi:MAG: bifunctional 2-methylcitrate synthase/citrate synthase [Bdellovibrionales bacterium]|nr:bifunctional 2-methylcitrate synthase/citrate synthase [Bdellovibrionales bacterium]